ncbi:MAG: DEAD/DEAH box helicase [Candidatus Omnitrophica bacterium]|nr:DEAD/DEAH box helicase [Candidatus Omnitrophota bacterium]MBU4457237.1 DEAD/DEAH box helicase [Candidatus Omnitrophota bacterium]
MQESIENIFNQSGSIANAMPGYEVRQEQIDMAKAVSSAIFNSETLIVEAGTGVGKSFSYLIPVARHALETGSLAVISTNTISLQEQIINKDIPFLEQALGIDFKAVLVKGRHNYLCLRRLRRSNLKQKDLFADEYEMREFAKIAAWSYRTEDGSLYDLDGDPNPKVWDMVSANTENCMGKKCPHHKQCFFQKAREKMKDARILVINHHLFFSNLAMQEDQKTILPEYGLLVFDEAHNIEDVATEHLGASISNTGIRYLMDLLFNPRKQKGFLLTIGGQDSMEWVELIRKQSDSFFKRIKEYFESRKLYGESGSLRIRKPNFVENNLLTPLLKLVDSLVYAKRNARNKEDEIEISAFIRKVNAANNSIELILNQALDNYVYWIGCPNHKGKGKISLNAAPVNIGHILKDSLFSSRKPMILTSATLSVDNGSFEYLRQRIGIDECKELKLGSPFDYKNQVRMYIVRNMPAPNRITEYGEAVAEKVKHYIELTNGSAFVLFTSYSLMNIVYEELETYLNEKGYNILRQGTGLGRSKMLSRFKKEAGSVLFGVDSFWQGIDVQGKALSNVIITKLPFAVPDYPVTEARIEDIQKRGGDAFLEYNLPEAVLRFKQGFGRLIRSKKDTGIIAVLDSRIINKSYGRQFLNSIPDCEIIIEK